MYGPVYPTPTHEPAVGGINDRTDVNLCNVATLEKNFHGQRPRTADFGGLNGLVEKCSNLEGNARDKPHSHGVTPPRGLPIFVAQQRESFPHVLSLIHKPINSRERAFFDPRA